MGWTETFYKRIFKDSDFKLRENDYVFGEKKVYNSLILLFLLVNNSYSLEEMLNV